MSGRRIRFGAAIPAVNPVVEAEFPPYLPDGVTVHVSRTWSGFDSGERKMREYREHLRRSGELLAEIDPDVVAFCATKASLWAGVGYEDRIEEELSAAAGGVPAVAAAASVVRALDSLGLGTIAVFTPYDTHANERIVEFLEGSGFAVDRVDRIGTAGPKPGGVSPERTYRRLTEADLGGVDCAFVSSTACETFEIIEPIERSIGKPVITSNQATLWDGCRVAGVDRSGIDLGALFET